MRGYLSYFRFGLLKISDQSKLQNENILNSGITLFLFHTKMKTLKTLFSSAIPTEYMQSKTKRTQNNTMDLFPVVEVTVGTHSNWSSSLSELLQCYDNVALTKKH